MTDIELKHQILGAAIEVHREPGPGLWEAVYQGRRGCELTTRGIPFEGRKPIHVLYQGAKLDCAYRADLLADGGLIVEIKALSALAPVREAMMITNLRLARCKIGLPIHFHPALLKDGNHPYVWKYEKPKNVDS